MRHQRMLGPDQRLLLRLDMEEFAFKDMPLELFRTLVEELPDLVHNADDFLQEVSAEILTQVLWGNMTVTVARS